MKDDIRLASRPEESVEQAELRDQRKRHKKDGSRIIRTNSRSFVRR